MNLKNNLALKDYELTKKYLNKYVLISVLGSFGLGVLVGEVGRKIKCERNEQINKKEWIIKKNYEGSELERLVERMIDRKYLD